MPNHQSYHGELSSNEAERRLLDTSGPLEGSNCYLTRYSNTNDSYSVSAVVHPKGSQKLVHLKLSIDTDQNCYDLEGSQKRFRTLDELLNYFEQNPLSSDIRALGTPCLPPDTTQHGTLPRSRSKKASVLTTASAITASNPTANALNTESGTTDPMKVILEMQDRFFNEMSKQREDHKKELEEERRMYREQIEREREAQREREREAQREKEREAQRKREREAQREREREAQRREREAANQRRCSIS